MKEVKFKDVKPGQQFSEINGSEKLTMKLQGHAVTCIPDEEFGNEFNNSVSLVNGRLRKFEDDELVYVDAK